MTVLIIIMIAVFTLLILFTVFILFLMLLSSISSLLHKFNPINVMWSILYIGLTAGITQLWWKFVKILALYVSYGG